MVWSDLSVIASIKLLQPNNKDKQHSFLKKNRQDLSGRFTKEDIQMANEYLKSHLTSLVIRKIQIKITMRYYYTLSRMAKMIKADNTTCWRCRATVTPTVWSVIWYNHFWKLSLQFLQNFLGIHTREIKTCIYKKARSRIVTEIL